MIFILYYSSNKLALQNALRHFSFRSGSQLLVRNLVREKRPIFWIKSSFRYKIRLDIIDKQCNYISLIYGYDHLFTAYELAIGSIYNRIDYVKLL